MKSQSKIYLYKNVLIIVSEMSQIINEAIKIHQLDNINSLVLASAINVFGPLSYLIKEEKGGFSIKIFSKNLESLVIETNKNGQIRASFNNKNYKIPDEYFKKYNPNELVGSFVGNSGFLKINKFGQKNDYSGQVPLQVGDFVSDLAFYFYQSQQTRSAIKNLIEIDQNLKITKAQSLIIQLLPNYSESEIQEIESWLKNKKIKDFIEFFENFELIGSKNWTYYCGCDNKNLIENLNLFTEKEVDDLIKNYQKIEFVCNFCTKTQSFTKKDWVFAKNPFSLATVESLTGGALAAEIVKTKGASKFFAGGIVCYQNKIKEKIGIKTENGVTNAKTALKMAEFGQNFFQTKYVISLTGNAGPEIQDGKLGQVFIALNEKVWELNLEGDRLKIINDCIKFAAEKINEIRPNTIKI
ncbi:Hsp33 family molecular chaperone HslO [Mesomycoplasma hyopneumoniae]|uniref:Hsp33 family molecular chaperone HslO n=1 Tax=Mesomycoplasma hyopneumoniae TaxID=2099 RepID=UPI0011B84A71|nr:Hsp33 family molecular chaperone HslO [Mesomycoplasma hyopneumoniae]QEA02355.1 33 kDa chaperonin [Mesomycoplasma hyopneumoniae]